MSVQLEHANLTVPDIDATAQFLLTAFPEFRIRRDGVGLNNRRYVHVGTDDTYIALNQSVAAPAEEFEPYSGKPGVNHLGYVVDDAEGLHSRLKDAGYKESTPPNNHPHRTRVYFYDPSGNDWEFVQYHSDDPAERNDYELAG